MDAPRRKVFVSGCYALLHSGHVAFFAEAAKLGDLYVGLGNDRNIAALKNRQTVNGEAERLYMVKAIRYVKDAWINSGSGILDFTAEVDALKPDVFFVNTATATKRPRSAARAASSSSLPSVCRPRACPRVPQRRYANS